MKHIATLALLVLVSGVSACQWSAPAPPSDAAACPPDRVVIRFGVHEGQLDDYQPYVDAFNADTSDMCVALVPFGGSGPPVAGATEEVITTVRQADVVELFRHQLNVDTEPLFLDLRPLIEADAAFDTADYFPNALEFIGPDQRVYMLPRVLDSAFLSYNQDLWTANNLPTPDATWTWDDVLDAAAQLTTRMGDTTTVYGLSDINYGLTTALFHLDAHGVDYMSLPVDEIDLTQPAYVDALDHVAALARTPYTFSVHYFWVVIQ